MAVPTFILLSPEKVAADPADALVIASNALAALSLAIEHVRVEDMDRASTNGFRNLFDAIRGTMDEAARQVRVALSEPHVRWEEITPITPEQCKAGRKLLGWSISDLRNKIGGILQLKTIQNFEDGKSHNFPTGRGAKTIRLVFQTEGVEFLPDGHVRLHTTTGEGE